MAIKITPDEFSLLIQRLNQKWRVFAPSAEFRGGRFSDTDNIIYQWISGWRDLIWHEKSHMSPNTIIAPITETLFYFDKDTIQIAETDISPIIIFAAPATLTPCRGWIICIYQMGIIPITVINCYGSIFVSSLLSVKKASKIVSASQWVLIKLTVIAPPCVLAMRARLSASAIPLSRRRYKGWGRRLTIPPLSSAKTGKPSSRRTAFAAIRKNSRHSHPPSAMGRLRQPLHQLWPLHYRVPNLYLL